MQEDYQDKLMAAKDDRMRKTSECLRNMRILKLHAWEDSQLTAGGRVAGRCHHCSATRHHKHSYRNKKWRVLLVPYFFKADIIGIQMKVERGMRVAVCGMVGSGKSSFLSCILGEILKISGEVRIYGSTTYASQSARIQS
ncbi:ABC transporter C family member 5 [Vitis vinifera]|uniref:ABC transporter C family member 5 n=2 Tax=Vitis vinifera TaxID=29760 RepID=A0A438JPE1_VITVI|nr:ABC transporter C family member 5 [Vitis vinifera]